MRSLWFAMGENCVYGNIRKILKNINSYDRKNIPELLFDKLRIEGFTCSRFEIGEIYRLFSNSKINRLSDTIGIKVNELIKKIYEKRRPTIRYVPLVLSYDFFVALGIIITDDEFREEAQGMSGSDVFENYNLKGLNSREKKFLSVISSDESIIVDMKKYNDLGWKRPVYLNSKPEACLTGITFKDGKYEHTIPQNVGEFPEACKKCAEELDEL